MGQGVLYRLRWKLLPILIPVILLLSCGPCVDFDSNGGCSSRPPVCGPPILEAIGDYDNSIAGTPLVLRSRVHFAESDDSSCSEHKHLVKYKWEQVSGPFVVDLLDSSYREPAFIPPSGGTYIFRCRASYPYCEDYGNDEDELPIVAWCFSSWILFEVNVDEFNDVASCTSPRAVAGDDFTLTKAPGGSRSITLNGNGSFTDRSWGCENLDIVTYKWTVEVQPSGSNLAIRDSDKAIATTALAVTGEYAFQLQVTDRSGRIDRNSVKASLIEPLPCNESLVVTVVDYADRDPLPGMPHNERQVGSAPRHREGQGAAVRFRHAAELE